MLESEKLALFLYFPEDKSEYIPAGITLFLFMVLAGVAMYVMIRISRVQEAKAKVLEEKLRKDKKRSGHK